ncbi:MAG: peptidylprolyl isomerase [Phycisphaerales bacterium]|jgi:cyclophilin family peptidyl-prolyl cis-trans isomerase
MLMKLSRFGVQPGALFRSAGRGLRQLLVGGARQQTLDSLEPRALLAGTPLPQLTDLESSSNAVVRIETNFGDIDIELFTSSAPISTTNFLTYVNSGRLSDTFFHRSAFNQDGSPFVLQGGGFRYKNGTGFEVIQTDAPIVRETTGRSNLARTLAFARTSSINSATDQWFINYVDNTFLDPTDASNGYAVFGRVVQGWNVVQTIQGLGSQDLTSQSAFQGSDNTAFGEVPTTSAFNGTVTEASLVQIRAAEVIKPSGFDGFFSQQVVMPEGFADTQATESLNLYNPNGVAARYQIIARYEFSTTRDTVIGSGTISAGATTLLSLSNGSNTSGNLVRSNNPYSIIVQTALPNGTSNPLPIAAASDRVDFNAETSEGFFNPAGYSNTDLRVWDFARVERNANSREFITWTNLSDQPTTVTLTFTNSSTTQTITVTTDAYRRGGLDLFRASVITGPLSVRITSTQNIVTYLSDFDVPAPGVPAGGVYTPGWSVAGTPGGGSAAGALSDVVVRPNFDNIISIANPNTVAAVVIFQFRQAGTSGSTSSTQIVFANSRLDFDLSTVGGLPQNTELTATYSSGSTLVTAQYTSTDNVGRNQNTGKTADGISSAFVSRIGSQTYFTNGAFDPARTDGTLVERISIYNPFSAAGVSINYTVRYSFSDGTAIDTFTGTLAPQDRIDLFTANSSAVRGKIGSNSNFRNYSITVFATANDAGSTAVSGLVQLTRIDTTLGRSISSTGTPADFGFPFNDSIFTTGGSGT